MPVCVNGAETCVKVLKNWKSDYSRIEWMTCEWASGPIFVCPTLYMHAWIYVYTHVHTNKACIGMHSPYNIDKIQWQFFLDSRFFFNVVSVLEAATLLAADHIHVSIQIHTYIHTYASFSTTTLCMGKFSTMLMGVSAELKKSHFLHGITLYLCTS